jgi:hypothetical protein
MVPPRLARVNAIDGRPHRAHVATPPPSRLVTTAQAGPTSGRPEVPQYESIAWSATRLWWQGGGRQHGR